MKKILVSLALLALSALGYGQTYPSPTYNNLTVNGAASLGSNASIAGGAISGTAISGGSVSGAAITGGTISGLTSPLPVASGGTNAATASGTALDNITGFSSTGFLTRTGAGAYAFQSLTNGITYANLAQASANTLLGNATGSTANVTAVSVTGCNGAAQALQWTNGSGFGCNSSIATSGANLNITSLSGLTTPLSVGQGGTGRATLTSHAALIGSGTSAITQVAPGTAGQALISAGASADPAWGYPTGTLIGFQRFTSSGTYTPDAGTNSVIAECLGGGGAGGGAAATAAGQVSVGGGGNAGAYAVGRFTTGFSGVTVTIGAAGTGSSAAAGGSGGNTTFGALLTANGGAGGAIGAGATTTPTISLTSGTVASASGGNIANVNGSFGEYGESIALGLNIGGKGASSQLGAGGYPGVNGAASTAGNGFGAGGGGAANAASSAAQAGSSGSGGVCIAYEYN